jgi:anti-sigma regulatory factor (Ser/Thr protein kinase)
MNTSLRLPVTDPSQAGEARRMAASWARERGCGPELMGSVALVVTELANNLVLHTRGGVLLLRSLHAADGRSGVEVLALDSGPGVRNIHECLRDGYSTAGTAGSGLGAVRRASQVFEAHSHPGMGTAVLSEVWHRPGPVHPQFQCGAASVPYQGEDVCGDSWAVQPVGTDRLRVIVADGLGHGDAAAEASRKAIEVFGNSARLPVQALFEAMHGGLRGTRGAAVAVADIDIATATVTYAGIGNISAAILHHQKTTSLVSLNGIVGIQYRNVQTFKYPWPAGATLVMQSDGIKTNWQMDRYTGLSERHPGLIAGVLYRDFHRPTDDATIVVLRPQS